MLELIYTSCPFPEVFKLTKFNSNICIVCTFSGYSINSTGLITFKSSKAINSYQQYSRRDDKC